MKFRKYKMIITAALLCASLLITGCEKKADSDITSSAPAATADAPVTQPAEEPDIGEHKDYDKEEAPCYESGEILVADQDGTKRGMETYTMTLREGCLEFYANELNQLKSDIGPKVKFYSMIVPTACELYCPSNERYLIDSQEKIISDVKDMLVGVEQVDVLPTLKNHNAENIYYRTDSRWTPLGAYYAGKVFAKAAGVPYPDISEYTKTAEKPVTGDLLLLCGPQADTELRAVPDSLIYYEPKAKFTTNYYDEDFTYLLTDKFYFGDTGTQDSDSEDEYYEGDTYETYSDSSSDPYADYYKGGFYCLRLDTKVGNGRKLLLVKDDFGTALPPFLTGSFSEIYVVSYNYLSANIAEFIGDFGITDVLYLMNTFTVTDNRVYTLETLRTQATHGNLKDNAPDQSDTDTDSDPDTSSSDTETDTEQTSSVQYIYDVGINNQIGIEESSDIGGLDQASDYYDDTQQEDQNVYEEDDYSYDYGEEY